MFKHVAQRRRAQIKSYNPSSLRSLFCFARSFAHLLALRPNDEDVGNRAVRDPVLGPVQNKMVAVLSRSRLHSRGIATVVGFGQPEAANELAAGEAGQVPAI